MFGLSGATPGSCTPGFEVFNSTIVPNTFSFSGLTGGPGSLGLALGPFKELSAD